MAPASPASPVLLAAAPPPSPPNNTPPPPSPPTFRSTTWTADGAALVALDSAGVLSTYILPPDLLSHSHALVSTSIRLPEPCGAYAAAPFFSLAAPETHTVITPCRDHPIHLRSLYGGVLGTYRLIDSRTEAFLAPSSLIWPGQGRNFATGAQNRIDLFDAYRCGGDGPILSIPTIPSKRHLAKGGGVGMRGIVSALALAPAYLGAQVEFGAGLLAAGTWTRWLGLYDLTRTPYAVGHWSVAGVLEGEFARGNLEGLGDVDVGGGAGVAQTAWSPCGRYMVVNERGAEALLVYDVRGTRRPVSALVGRRTGTSLMRFGCDVYPSASGFEVWAGCVDGTVVVWDGVGEKGGCVEGQRWDEGSGAAVGSAVLHPGGAVVATASGGWERDYEEGGRRVVGGRLAVWLWDKDKESGKDAEMVGSGNGHKREAEKDSENNHEKEERDPEAVKASEREDSEDSEMVETAHPEALESLERMGSENGHERDIDKDADMADSGKEEPGKGSDMVEVESTPAAVGSLERVDSGNGHEKETEHNPEAAKSSDGNSEVTDLKKSVNVGSEMDSEKGGVREGELREGL